MLLNRIVRKVAGAKGGMLKRIAVWLCLAVGVRVAFVLLLQGSSAYAAICPSCYGFAAEGGGLYVEAGLDADTVARIEDEVKTGEAEVEAFYGKRLASPRIIVCGTPACYERIHGGGSTGMAMLDEALFLSPRATAVIAAHELSHIELHARLGKLGTWRRDVPQWFDEGTAVLVSDDARYLKPAGEGDRCTADPDGDLPTQRAAWIENAGSLNLYARAACRVSRWVAANGGPAAVEGLVAAVAGGEAFADAYGKP